ncbi:thioesterase family protein [soil metagenome]
MRMHVEIPLRWSDFDAYAHVNNASMLRLLEEARIQAFWKPDADSAAVRETALLDMRPGAETMNVISRQEIEYLVSIPYLRKPVDIEMWFGRISGASLEICYEVYSPVGVEPRVLYTRAATTVVTIDRETGRPKRLPTQNRATWDQYVEEPIRFRH